MVLHTKKMVIRLLTQADSEAEIKTKQKHRLLHICPVSSELKRCPPPPPYFSLNVPSVVHSLLFQFKTRLPFHPPDITPLQSMVMVTSQPSSPTSQLYRVFQASICQALSPLHCAFPSVHFQGC